jgi:hypothetical protein
MRKYQKEFFKTHDATALRQSKALEKEVDDMIAQNAATLHQQPRQPKQQSLFHWER